MPAARARKATGNALSGSESASENLDAQDRCVRKAKERQDQSLRIGNPPTKARQEYLKVHREELLDYQREYQATYRERAKQAKQASLDRLRRHREVLRQGRQERQTQVKAESPAKTEGPPAPEFTSALDFLASVALALEGDGTSRREVIDVSTVKAEQNIIKVCDGAV